IERLQSVTAALAGALDFEAVANVFVTRAVEAAGARAGAIFLRSDDDASLVLARAEGYADGAFPLGSRVPVDAPMPVSLATRTKEPVYVSSPAEWRSRFGEPRAQTWHRSDAWAALPVVARDRVIAVLGLSFVGAPAFDADTRAFLLSLAQQCGQALDRATLFDAAVQARHSAEEARRAAQEANHAKSAFLAMMSHELRTPLNAIGGYTELLELGLRGPVTPAQLEDLTRIRRNKDHLLSIINDILNLARIEAGHLAVHLEDVPVAVVLSELEGVVAPLIRAKGLRYEVAGAAAGQHVRADRERLQQVLLNFVSNAVRFTDAGGTVTLTCDEAAGETIRFAVRDTGIGIPADRLEAIFEPFVQVDAGLTRRTGGTGLGLAISRDLARAMGGRIAVESELGRGSVFSLFLPRARFGAEVPSTAGRATPATRVATPR
ncbi:MAG TPA: ATP-binding protein, partial [Gemmatimonadaceae bacterium]|nr:ATP-binding protein [Gemmatimonadaceae bacterium]